MKVSVSLGPHVHVQQASALERRTDAEMSRLHSEEPSTVAPGDDRDVGGRFRAIYDTWFEDVARWIRALGGLESDRDDIAQEVFLVVRRRLQSFDGANPAGWLYRITRRQVRDFRRRTWVKHIFNKRRSDEPDILPHGGSSPATELEDKEKQRVLHTLLQKMDDDRRSALVLFEIEGLSGEEIARIQSIPVNTVWTRLHHARKEFFALAARYRKAHGGERGERGERIAQRGTATGQATAEEEQRSASAREQRKRKGTGERPP
ncbi:MAG: RNA polymerase sigma factor [Myxococcales bacterium]